MQIGQVVRRRKTPAEKGSKLEALWTDPWWITKVIGKGCYWIQGLTGRTHKVNRKDIDPIKDSDLELHLGEKCLVENIGVLRTK